MADEASSIQAEDTPVQLRYSRPSEWWFIELWYEQRPLFKELVKHLFVFAIIFGTLETTHWLLGKSHIEPARLYVLNAFHFWGSIVLLVIFVMSLMIKVFLFEVGRPK